jgi:hypothetical protein
MMRYSILYGDQSFLEAGMTMWVFLLVLLVGFVLTLIGVGISLYFYRKGLMGANKVERYPGLNTVPADAEDQELLEEERFYRDLTSIESGPSRFSLVIASVVLLLIFGLILSVIISAFVR